MTINITSKQMEITPAIRQHITERLSRLQKWQAQLINPHIILSKQPQSFVADATISTANGQLVASASHSDMYLAINELINKLERQLNKVRHKPQARRACHSLKESTIKENTIKESPITETDAKTDAGAADQDQAASAGQAYRQAS